MQLLAMSADGSLVSGSTWCAEGGSTIIDLETGSLVSSFTYVDLLGGCWNNPAVLETFSPDGELVASYFERLRIKVWDVKTGLELSTIPVSHQPRALAFHPDKSKLAIAEDNLVRLWNPRDLRQVDQLTPQAVAVSSLGFSSDGRWLATGLEDGTVQVWDMWSMGKVRSLGSQHALITSVAFASESRLLASGDATGQIWLWDLANSQGLGVLAGHMDEVASLIFDVSGRFLASSSQDKTALLWDVSEARAVTSGVTLGNYTLKSVDRMIVPYRGGGEARVTVLAHLPGSDAWVAVPEVLVDTGASGAVLLPASLAKELDIDFKEGKPTRVLSATGIVDGWAHILELAIVDLSAATEEYAGYILGGLGAFIIDLPVVFTEGVTERLLPGSEISEHINLLFDSDHLSLETKECW